MSDFDKLSLRLKTLADKAKRWKGWRKVRAFFWGWVNKYSEKKVDDLNKNE